MTLRIHAVTPEVWAIEPDGRLDLPASRAIEDALRDLCNAGNARVVIDLTEVMYVASAGAILETMSTAVQAHVGARESFDDMTMVVLKRSE